MEIPFATALEDAQHILLAGAGGGFDIFAGLPLYYAWRSRGKKVSLANLSFSVLVPTAGENLTPDCIAISPDSDGSQAYFPEKHLSAFLHSRGDPAQIWAIRRTGCKPVAEAYQALADRLKPDAIVLIDGGTDSLMRGDEEGLGTPQEDMASILAASAISIAKKFLVCTAFGVDYFHGVGNGHTFEAIAELTRAGGFRGAFSLPPDMPEVHFYKDALEYTHRRMPACASIVNTSVLSSMLGFYGNHHTNKRTEGSELHITPLMSVYWTFLLDHVANRLLYHNLIRNTETYQELTIAIETYRDSLPRLRLHSRALA